MIWLKEHEPEIYARTHSFLISSKDYVIRQLTGVCVTDPTSAATAGCMQIRSRTWMERWLEAYGVSWFKMPPIVRSDEVVGYVHAQGESDTGFTVGTPVLCGIGDAGAATLGAGVLEEGEIYAYLGTTGWVASVSEAFMDVQSGAFNLSFVEDGRQISVAPLTNAGNAHQWAVEVFGPPEVSNMAATYEDLDLSVERVTRGRSGVVFLPYLNGERCPIQDVNATGCFIGLKPTTTKEEMVAAVLEGVAMAMREIMDLVVRSEDQRRVTLIGGGANSKVWTQIIADVLQCELVVPEDSQYLPSIGAAMLGFVSAGWATDYGSLSASIRSAQKYETFAPNRSLADYYDRQFAKYKKLYPALAPVFD
jgi:xylulokinase